MDYFRRFFKKKIKNLAFNFRALEEKHKLFGNFEKILKSVDKNSLEKLNVYLLLEKFLLKIEPSEITSFFYNIFSISAGDVPCVPPGGAYAYSDKISSA